MKRLTRADLESLRVLERTLKEIRRTVAIKIARSTASLITELAQETFRAGQNAYGDPWLPSILTGQAVDLVRDGDLGRSIHYVAIGTKLRARLGPRYTKYQVGRRPVLPRGKLPLRYAEILRKNANRIIEENMKGRG